MRARIRRLSPLLLTLLLLLAIPLVFVACTSPSWLPDSSGFLFVDLGGNVVLHRVKANKRQTIAKLPMIGADAVLSPDGKQVVAARIVGGKENAKLQFDFFDLNGKNTHTSPPMTQSFGKDTSRGLLQLEMSSDNRHVVAFLMMSNSAVIYDKKNRTFRVVKNIGMIPGYTAVWPMIVRHCSPDGKGFAAVRGLGVDEAKMAYVTWDEDEPIEVKIPREIMNLAENSSIGKNVGVLTRTTWKNGQMMSRFEKGVLRFDVKNRKLTYVEDKVTVKLLEHAKKHQVVVVAELADGGLIQIKDRKQVEIYRPGKEVIPLVSLTKDAAATILPSPNGRYVFARVSGERPVVHVVSVSGETILRQGMAKK